MTLTEEQKDKIKDARNRFLQLLGKTTGSITVEGGRTFIDINPSRVNALKTPYALKLEEALSGFLDLSPTTNSFKHWIVNGFHNIYGLGFPPSWNLLYLERRLGGIGLESEEFSAFDLELSLGPEKRAYEIEQESIRGLEDKLRRFAETGGYEKINKRRSKDRVDRLRVLEQWRGEIRERYGAEINPD